jgi:hypothetical protein
MAGTKKTKADQIRGYIQNGWAPVPVPKQSKNPGFDNWEKYRAIPDEVEDAFRWNVGLILGDRSGGLVDVDLDTTEAISLARHMLPETGMMHGRKGKPWSHYWYVTDPTPDTKRYKDTDGATLVELRSTGGQTIVPPSIHPDGEPIGWVKEGAPLVIDGRVLSAEVAKLAAASLLVRHWPAEGSRHDLCLCLAGALFRNGWGLDQALGFILTIALEAGDDEPKDREDAVRSTWDSLGQGKAVTGIPTLAGIIGERETKRLGEWLGWRSPSTGGIVFRGVLESPGDVLADPIDLSTMGQVDWKAVLDQTPLDLSVMPYWVQRLLSHTKPYTVMFPPDWPVTFILTFWSALWPGIRIQNLGLNLWAIGLNVQSGGKNVMTDEMLAITRGVVRMNPHREVTLYTAGTPEGMWEALAGEGKQMLCYHDEFAGFLKLLQRDHMQSARESLCSLYDGRGVGYLRSKRNTVDITNPHVVVAATCTPTAIRNHGSIEDMANGYLSRFLVCAPDATMTAPNFFPEDNENRRQIIRELDEHLKRVRDVRSCIWEETGGRQDPEILVQYRGFFGVNSGEVIDLDTAMDETGVPVGRLVARAKKIAALLELAEYAPQLSEDGSQLSIRPDHVETAIDIVERGRAYAERLASWIGRSGDWDLSRLILSELMKTPEGLTQRELCRRTRQPAREVGTALSLLSGAGQASSRKSGKTERWWAGDK